MDFKDILFSKADSVIQGKDYNRVSYEMREKGNERLIFYEVILPEDKGWEYLRDKIYPEFIRFLKMKKIDPEAAPGTIVSLFYRDRCYLIKGSEFLKAFMEMEGLNSSAFHFRVLRWLSDLDI